MILEDKRQLVDIVQSCVTEWLACPPEDEMSGAQIHESSMRGSGLFNLNAFRL
jgi:hypothetical protein